ncbi:hypothetical protein Dimus_027793 [Dionaea muscipula]
MIMKKTHHFFLDFADLHLLFLFTLITASSLAQEDSDSSSPSQGLVCNLINCGEGKCVESNTSFFGVDCQCNPGWNKLQFGPLIFPACVIPNCTVNFDCGSGSPSPAVAPPPSAVAGFNLFDICSYMWCGDGSCRKNGSSGGYSCECNAGSANLMNSSSLPCFKPCYLGANCVGLNISVESPPTSSPPPPPPPPIGSMPPRLGRFVKDPKLLYSSIHAFYAFHNRHLCLRRLFTGHNRHLCLRMETFHWA